MPGESPLTNSFPRPYLRDPDLSRSPKTSSTTVPLTLYVLKPILLA